MASTGSGQSLLLIDRAFVINRSASESAVQQAIVNALGRQPSVYTPWISSSSFGEAHDSEADAVYRGVNEEAEWGVQRSPKLERRGVYIGDVEEMSQDVLLWAQLSKQIVSQGLSAALWAWVMPEQLIQAIAAHLIENPKKDDSVWTSVDINDTINQLSLKALSESQDQQVPTLLTIKTVLEGKTYLSLCDSRKEALQRACFQQYSITLTSEQLKQLSQAMQEYTGLRVTLAMAQLPQAMVDTARAKLAFAPIDSEAALDESEIDISFEEAEGEKVDIFSSTMNEVSSELENARQSILDLLPILLAEQLCLDQSTVWNQQCVAAIQICNPEAMIKAITPKDNMNQWSPDLLKLAVETTDTIALSNALLTSGDLNVLELLTAGLKVLNGLDSERDALMVKLLQEETLVEQLIKPSLFLRCIDTLLTSVNPNSEAVIVALLTHQKVLDQWLEYVPHPVALQVALRHYQRVQGLGNPDLLGVIEAIENSNTFKQAVESAKKAVFHLPQDTTPEQFINQYLLVVDDRYQVSVPYQVGLSTKQADNHYAVTVLKAITTDQNDANWYIAGSEGQPVKGMHPEQSFLSYTLQGDQLTIHCPHSRVFINTSPERYQVSVAQLDSVAEMSRPHTALAMADAVELRPIAAGVTLDQNDDEQLLLPSAPESVQIRMEAPIATREPLSLQGTELAQYLPQSPTPITSIAITEQQTPLQQKLQLVKQELIQLFNQTNPADVEAVQIKIAYRGLLKTYLQEWVAFENQIQREMNTLEQKADREEVEDLQLAVLKSCTFIQQELFEPAALTSESAPGWANHVRDVVLTAICAAVVVVPHFTASEVNGVDDDYTPTFYSAFIAPLQDIITAGMSNLIAAGAGILYGLTSSIEHAYHLFKGTSTDVEVPLPEGSDPALAEAAAVARSFNGAAIDKQYQALLTYQSHKSEPNIDSTQLSQAIAQLFSARNVRKSIEQQISILNEKGTGRSSSEDVLLTTLQELKQLIELSAPEPQKTAQAFYAAINKEQLQHRLTRIDQVRAVIMTGELGTALGLAISALITELNKHIDPDNNPDHQTSFAHKGVAWSESLQPMIQWVSTAAGTYFVGEIIRNGYQQYRARKNHQAAEALAFASQRPQDGVREDRSCTIL